MTHRDAFPTFAAAVAARLEAGAVTYVDRSFDRDPAELAGEIEQELLDVCAWSFILWCRVRALHRNVSSTKPSPGFGQSLTILEARER